MSQNLNKNGGNNLNSYILVEGVKIHYNFVGEGKLGPLLLINVLQLDEVFHQEHKRTLISFIIKQKWSAILILIKRNIKDSKDILLQSKQNKKHLPELVHNDWKWLALYSKRDTFEAKIVH